MGRITGSCHCGAVRFKLADTPQWLTRCNCSMRRRIGALWAHAEVDKIKIFAGDGATVRYIWGDRTLAFHTCRTCGCTSHWESLDPARYNRMAVNCNLAGPKDIAGLRIRQFDGAGSWQYLD